MVTGYQFSKLRAADHEKISSSAKT